MITTNSYILCATPRSGSTLLCDLLAATGVAGNPDSFFRRESFRWWCDHLNISFNDWSEETAFDSVYLDAIRRQGMGNTQMFGMRIMRESVNGLVDRLGEFYPEGKTDHEKLTEAFGSIRYLYLSRKNRLAQAISLLKAEQSGLWHINGDGSERERLKPVSTPEYDARAIEITMRDLELQDTAWRSWFEQQGIKPFLIHYKTLAESPKTILGEVLSFLGKSPEYASEVEPQTRKLADRLNSEWADRYSNEPGR